jgi:high affinity Mn2+ porin
MRFRFIKFYIVFINKSRKAAVSILARLVALLFWLSFGLPQVALAGMPESESIGPSVSATLASQSSPIPEVTTPESWSVHGQFTNVTQWHPSFNAPYSGANSLDSNSKQANTNDATLYLGARLWQGGEFYINPEIDEGFGLSDTLGVAGFPSGEAYKVGKNHPYLRWQRIFYRQVIDLGGEEQKVESGANQLAGTKSACNVTLTIGKFSVVDIFDTNAYAHDPRIDFLNWSILDAGAFDYAADAWGYTNGLAAEWNQSWWTLRGGLFDLSKIPNSTQLETNFSQHALIGEAEERHQWWGHPGKLKLLGFVNRGHMASYDDSVRLTQQTGGPPDVALVRHFDSRPGMAINLEQEITSNLGMFVKASINDGSKESFEFTEINQSLSAGFSLRGNRWRRPDDAVGIAGVVNGLSGDARAYFAAGGLGILIGDGQLPHYGTERILETYYTLQLNQHIKISLNYQYIVNPAYSTDRGPVSILGFRAHVEF